MISKNFYGFLVDTNDCVIVFNSGNISIFALVVTVVNVFTNGCKSSLRIWFLNIYSITCHLI